MTKNAHAAALGRMGLGKRKRLSDADRQRRREQARGLAALRATARKVREEQAVRWPFVVIDRQGRQWTYEAQNVQHAITLARYDGIDAVGGRAQTTKGNEQ